MSEDLKTLIEEAEQRLRYLEGLPENLEREYRINELLLFMVRMQQLSLANLNNKKNINNSIEKK